MNAFSYFSGTDSDKNNLHFLNKSTGNNLRNVKFITFVYGCSRFGINWEEAIDYTNEKKKTKILAISGQTTFPI